MSRNITRLRLHSRSLGQAIREGDAKEVQMYLLSGRRVKKEYLNMAAKQGDADKVAALMAHARSAFPDETCQEVMVHALQSESINGSGIVRALLEAGVSPNFSDKDYCDLETPLHMAVRIETQELIKLLLQHGANTNAQDEKGCTPLHVHTNPEVVCLLIQHGADPNIANKKGLTPLHQICGEGDLAAAKELKGADPNAQDRNDETPLHYACAKGNLDMIKWLVDDAGANPQPLAENSVFLSAALSLETQLVGALIDLGVNPLQRDSQGNTVLHQLILSDTSSDGTKMGKIALLPFLRELHKRTPNLVNERNHNQETALHLAVKFGEKSMIRFLVDECQADLNAKDKFGRTPAFQAVFYSSSFVEVMDLVKDRIDINAKDANGWTMLHWSVFLQQSGDALYLLEHGADRNIPNHRRRVPLHMVGFPFHTGKSSSDRNVLSYTDYDISAALKNVRRTETPGTMEDMDAKLVEELITGDGNALVEDADGNLPFFLAASSGCLSQTFMMIQKAASEGMFGKKGSVRMRTNSNKRYLGDVEVEESSPAKRVNLMDIESSPADQSRAGELTQENSRSEGSEATLGASHVEMISPNEIKLGDRIAVYWEEDHTFYSGTVTQLGQGEFELLYDDNVTEWVTADAQIKRAEDDEAIQELKRAIDRIKEGDRISIWWPREREFFNGTVVRHDPALIQPIKVEYDDGDEEWLSLMSRPYKLI